MFENIIGLETVTADLTRAITTGSLPRSILLTGPRYGGKSTLALEIARTCTCHDTGRWGCQCRSCVLHRTVSHPDLVCAGPRYFDLEIAAAQAAFRSVPRPGTLFLLIRSVRKLVRRFDRFLWDQTRLKKISPAIDNVEKILQEIEPAPDAGDGFERTRTLENVAALDPAVEKLLGLLPREITPIDLVRAIGTWAHVSSAGGQKVVILEEAHTLQEGARNSMLKLLEEPPEGVRLILTSSNRSAIIPTVLSRLREYPLPERSGSEQARVQERIFRVDAVQEGGLARFFRSAGIGSDTRRRELADQLVTETLAGAPSPGLLDTVRKEYAGSVGGMRSEFFFEELTEAVRRRFPGASPEEMSVLQRWGPLIRSYRSRIEVRNMNPVSTISALVLLLHQCGTQEGG